MKNIRDGAAFLVMSSITQSRIWVRRFARPVGFVCIVFYLGFHTFHGERGLYALMREQKELHLLKKDLTETTQKREQLEARVTRLRDGSIDLDLLDEQMRRMLGVSKPGEIVIMEPKS
jgi:cell division protein FtsB